ncbi:MAG: ABC transporter ATP-binding protein [Chloroflexota bacterium]
MQTIGERTRQQYQTLVQLEGVEKTYGSGAFPVQALKGVDLTISRGEFVVILGPSGSGKTTLLNIVGGIDTPTAGRVIIGDEDLSRYDARRLTDYRRRQVGFVFQFFNLIPTLTALENVSLVAELTTGRAERSADWLALVGLGDRLGHFPQALSGGEQQRVAIARALAKDPALLLCDEPTGALDLANGRRVLGLLRRLQGERRQTVLLVTHNSAIAGMADRVIRMRSGEVVEDRMIEQPLPAEEVTW